MNGIIEPMEEDAYADDYADSSQQPTQSTQQASQTSSQDPAYDTHVWGYLQPCREGINRIDLWKIQPTVKVGRSSENDVFLANMKISNKHCWISWDGKESDTSIVTVHDFSSNGTFINGNRVGKGKTAILRDGNELGLGSWGGHMNVSPADDFRYIFRLTAQGPPRDGLYAHYDIGHELGKGSFATVVSAISRDNGHKYAVKMINKARFRSHSNTDQMGMFLREISILERLKHPNICQLKEVFTDTNNINLVLEFVEGGDLLEYIIKNGGLSESVTRSLTRQLCDALMYIHSMGIAHRDLKPENVLLTSDNPPILKVADFGLAKAVNSMTRFKTTCGTPCYLAPEVVLRGPEEEYSHMVDSWSVGVIVFSALANASPFIENEQQNIATRFKERYIDWDILLQRNLTSTCVDFVRRLLDLDPHTRLSCTDALSHPWLVHEDALAIPRGLEPVPSYESNVAEDGSIISIVPVERSKSVIRAGDEGAPEGLMEGIDYIRLQDSILARYGRRGPDYGRKLHRRLMEVGERDEKGQVQYFDNLPPVPAESTPRPKAWYEVEDENRSRKRKDRSEEAEDGVFTASDESELTPMSEADAEEDSPAIGVRNLRARKKATASPPSPRARGGRTPAKRTRAGRKVAGGDNGDVDM